MELVINHEPVAQIYTKNMGQEGGPLLPTFASVPCHEDITLLESDAGCYHRHTAQWRDYS
jgi:hypothetical protein